MASEHSFDISGEVSVQELKNALEQAKKELETRYDFKGVQAEFELNEKDSVFTLSSSSDGKIEPLKDILISKLIKRGINPAAIQEQGRTSGALTRLNLRVNNSIDSENAKKSTKPSRTASSK